MANFNFKKQTKVYIVYQSNRYEIDVTDINFSQTFTEESYTVKTLHDQSKMFDGSVINKANPCNFNLSLPLLSDIYHDILFNLALDYDSTAVTKSVKSFDIYVSTPISVHKITTAVITNFVVNIDRTDLVTLDITGEAIKLEKYSISGTYPEWNIPGTLVPKPTTYSYITPISTDVKIDTVDINNPVVSVSIELQNNINWVEYKTLNKALSATDASSSMYPSIFSLTNRILAGSITIYLESSNSSMEQEWSSDSSLYINIGDGTSYIMLDMPNVTYTNRLGTEGIFIQTFDWRLTNNPASLSSLFIFAP